MADENPDLRNWYPATVQRGDGPATVTLCELLKDTWKPGECLGGHWGAKPKQVEFMALARVIALCPYYGEMQGGWGSIEWKESPDTDSQGAGWGGERIVLFRWC